MNGPVAIVGADGFIGAALCRALQADGVHVVRFTRRDPAVCLDGTAPAPLLEADTVFYLAGSSVPATAERDPGLVTEETRALARLLDALRDHPRRPRVLLASSGGRVYDTVEPPPYRESNRLGARDRYGEAKIALEQRLLDAGGAWEPVVLRIGNAYGPGQPARRGHGVVAYWLDSVARGEPIRAFGSPDACRDYVFIDDVVAALRLAALAARPPRVVNVGSGRPTTLKELAEVMGEVVGGIDVRWEPSRGFDPERTWLDVTLARDALDWAPRVGLREGLERAWAHRGVEG